MWSYHPKLTPFSTLLLLPPAVAEFSWTYKIPGDEISPSMVWLQLGGHLYMLFAHALAWKGQWLGYLGSSRCLGRLNKHSIIPCLHRMWSALFNTKSHCFTFKKEMKGQTSGLFWHLLLVLLHSFFSIFLSFLWVCVEKAASITRLQKTSVVIFL